ncbi:MAG: LacI family transcriptional regulator, partial [Melioribacteraceae bacterium]|nr:LacI family transcriptional regulator [Melioribacteraceae bacterium]
MHKPLCKNKNLNVTLKNIAEKTGCSVSTISRVLNKKGKQFRISKETQELILRTAEELDYKPNELARGLRLKKSNTIGLLVPDISNPFFAHVTHIIQQYAYSEGYTLIVCNTNEDISLEIDHIDLLRRKGVDGFIILPVGTESAHIKELANRNFPFVLMDRIFENLDSNAVVVDNQKGSYQAVKHLIDNGHTRIAIIQGLKKTSTNSARLKGYSEALREANIELDDRLIVGNDFRRENGYIETKLLLKRKDPPTAIFSTGDLITLGILEAMSEESKSIPKDISLVSFDDIDYAPFLVAPLT